MESRLKDIGIFEGKSLILVAKKVAQYSGDIRRSLQITRRAVELGRDEFLKNGNKVMINTGHVSSACDEI